MYNRLIEASLKKNFFKGKIIIIVGARQTGKTTLAKKIIEKFPATEIRSFNGDNPADRELLNDRSFEFLDNLIGAA
ncbi:MAG: AAA family ATPase, partial [Patescibacteria group bacterium]